MAWEEGFGEGTVRWRSVGEEVYGEEAYQEGVYDKGVYGEEGTEEVYGEDAYRGDVYDEGVYSEEVVEALEEKDCEVVSDGPRTDDDRPETGVLAAADANKAIEDAADVVGDGDGEVVVAEETIELNDEPPDVEEGVVDDTVKACAVYACQDWVEEIEVGDTVFAEWIEEPPPTLGLTEEPCEGTNEDSRYSRLFTDEKLDALDECSPGQEATALAGETLAVEEEEYEKELEDRL
ncbi:hypothetical protein PHYPSEUDO_006695 [Phytophthora pseudosyringae]|uniref:Uncharacterized protein n=1 Tax=Phytophthora pseudosyringae TaxID=221518 RepID=A0A8T1VI54_9STRA|nr:hypothetical protein PHYPSEUDO_006695 [Phytophthora pseudosyringae]